MHRYKNYPQFRQVLWVYLVGNKALLLYLWQSKWKFRKMKDSNIQQPQSAIMFNIQFYVRVELKNIGINVFFIYCSNAKWESNCNVSVMYSFNYLKPPYIELNLSIKLAEKTCRLQQENAILYTKLQYWFIWTQFL
jgi:hypothetical protein